MKKYVTLENASIDITKYTVKNLKIHHYERNSQKENFKLIENSLRQYSLNKLEDLDKSLDDYQNYSLSDLLEELNYCIFTCKERDAFFKQYTHCIVQLIGELRKQEQITWIPAELDTDIDIIKDGKAIKAIITSDKLQPYQVPTTILNEYKKVLTK